MRAPTRSTRTEPDSTRLGDTNSEHVRRTAPYAVGGAVLFPLVPWLMAGSVGGRFDGVAALKSVANLAALFSIAAWAANLVLASRIRPIERAFGGLEHRYRLHRRMGLLVVGLAVAHVFFLTAHAAGEALDLYLPSAGWGTFTGVIALVLLLGFVVASLVGGLSYQTFALIQRLLGMAFVLGALHTFAVGGTTASSRVLAAYLAALTAAGCASVGYRLLGSALGIGR
jgi:predicted ferric reductase